MSEEVRPFYLFKLCLIGNGGVGKTAIARRLCFDTFEMDTQATIGIDFYTYDIKIITNGEEKTVRLILWDFGGQEQFKKIFGYYIGGANGIFMVFSAIDSKSLVDLDWWYRHLNNLNLTDVPRIVIGTKYDLVESQSDPSDTIEDSVSQYMEKHGETLFFKTSAKNNLNIRNIFVEMSKIILDKHNFRYEKIL